MLEMKEPNFVYDLNEYGLPTYEELKDYRIWDTHYHGFGFRGNPLESNKKMLKIAQRMGIERVIALDILKVHRPPGEYLTQKENFVTEHQSFFSALLIIDPGYPEESCEAMDKWIGEGPCIGIKYSGVNKSDVLCDHPNNDAIMRKADELNAVIYIHTWIKIGGDPRYPGGGNFVGENAPWNVAKLAKRFPDVRMICGHSGGDWELGARSVRPYENVYFEFAGADPQSGSVDFAVNELGTDRIVWGGHGPSRSFSTELAKVLDANISHENKFKIFGANYRDLARDIFRDKGISMDPHKN